MSATPRTHKAAAPTPADVACAPQPREALQDALARAVVAATAVAESARAVPAGRLVPARGLAVSVQKR
jgi:hypothetical protein